MSERTEVGVYYFPNYHVDPRNEQVHGPGWTEWSLVKQATPRFPGHRQPREPVWGYTDEADPAQMAQKIDAAADHGVTYWIFDWYWYDDGPFLQRGLDEGFLGAANNNRLKFCCMWANHDWINLHPAKYHDPREVLYPGQISPATFDTMTDHVVSRYFTHPSHFQIDGCPYFSFYDLQKLVEVFGSVAATRAGLDAFRAKTRAAGFRDAHLNAVVWGRAILPGESQPASLVELVKALGFDSFTSYVWVHHAAMTEFPETEYAAMRDTYLAYWDQVEQDWDLPYYPNVTMGWDSSPRTVQSDVFQPVGYPFMGALAHNTPEAFREALAQVKERLDRRTGPRIMNINAWNEWTEGSYLEPDTVYGTGYLAAIREVFGA